MQRLHLVDVFAERRYAGNPLAVVIGDTPLPEATMQAVAAEIDYSETCFVVPHPEADGGYRVRLFTPAREIAFAGHPILGTAAVLRRHLALPAGAALRLNLSIGPVPVSFEMPDRGPEVAWFRAPPVALAATCERGPVAAALGLDAADVDAQAPVQVLAAGTDALLVPLRGLAALRRARLDLTAYAPLAARGLPPRVYLFCREPRDAGHDLSARFFFEARGLREDPATGNGAAFLGAYLLAHRLLPGDALALRIGQGHEMGRPSLVRLQARRAGPSVEIRVGGSVIPTVQGELL